MFICNDCLAELSQMPAQSVDLVYLDPPFFTQRKQQLRDKQGKAYSFNDTWDSRQEYLQFMEVRLRELRRVLKDTGSLFLHCDTKASHYLRILLDDVFGEDFFQSEIIWTYKRWSNSQKGLIPGHQTIFFYTKTKEYTFHPMYTDYSPTTNIDQILQERVRNANGKAEYKYDAQGNPVLSKAKKGVPLSDVWDIPFLNPKAKERTGYPTQKPIALLERIITMTTKPGDVVLDPFCGSGTTVVAAALLQRKGIGIDWNPEAVAIGKRRLQAPCKTESKAMKLGMDAYKTKNDYELSILQSLQCTVVQRNKGIDGFLKEYYQGKPVAVKIQKANESLGEAGTLLVNAARKKQCFAAILIRTQKADNACSLGFPSWLIILDSYAIQSQEALHHLGKSGAELYISIT